MKFYFDENISPKIVSALQILETDQSIEILSIKDEYGKGVADEVWIPLVGQNAGVVITQDQNLRRIRHHRALCERNNLGVVIFKPPSKKGYTYWEWIVKIINSWENIKYTSKREKPPFVYVIRPNSHKLVSFRNL